MSSEEAKTLIEAINLLRDEVASLRDRQPAAADIIWVDEQELAQRIPYTARQLRQMRKRGVFRHYPCRAGTKKVLYNLGEVYAVIAGSDNSRPILDYDSDNIRIEL